MVTHFYIDWLQSLVDGPEKVLGRTAPGDHAEGKDLLALSLFESYVPEGLEVNAVEPHLGEQEQLLGLICPKLEDH